ncbi:MAG: hypothetical protein IJX85_07215 [Lachnospiraceae bacterium]|nr:hypothetical protein [Lachnospiraceae bacterium]
MIDENKVALMTKIAIYEKKEGSRNLMLSKYYKSDYVRFNVLKTMVAATVAFWTIVGAYVFIKFDDLLAKVSEVDYFDVMYKVLGAYVFFLVAYFFFAQIVYSFRYSMAKPGLIAYNVNLKRLIEAYGGKRKKKKTKVNTKMLGAVVEDEIEFEEAPQPANKIKLKRTDMISKKKQQEEEERNQQIIENAQRRKEWLARKEAEKAENDRRKEEERRKREQALYAQQQAYLNQQTGGNMQQSFVREDFTVQGDANYNPNYANQNGQMNGRSDS